MPDRTFVDPVACRFLEAMKLHVVLLENALKREGRDREEDKRNDIDTKLMRMQRW